MKNLTIEELILINGGSPKSFGKSVGCAFRCFVHGLSDFWRGFYDEL